MTFSFNVLLCFSYQGESFMVTSCLTVASFKCHCISDTLAFAMLSKGNVS